jgi:hypothetical protein
LDSTAKWNLSGDGGRQGILALNQMSETQPEIDQSDVDDPDAPQVTLDIDHANDSYGLHALSFKAHDNTLWIFFGPVLPLPVHLINDKTTVTFTVAENEQATAASGELEVQRANDAKHLLWRLVTPSVARSTSFETGVNVIPNIGEHTSCVNEDCLRSPKQ